MEELESREVFTEDPTVERLPCRGCGKVIELWFNGGELDTKACCGYVYSLSHGPIYLTVYGPTVAPVP